MSHNYQNAIMHKSEPRVNPTLITHANELYEFRAGIIMTH